MTRRHLRRLLLWVLERHMVRRAQEPSPHSAIVFAPHPDDETIGCGGTIARKAELGARIQVVYLTDGAKSHSTVHGVTPDKMSATRRQEALAACQQLGVEHERVRFLDFPDGELSTRSDDVVRELRHLIAAVQPDEIFIPYFRDRHADHIAANQLVKKALTADGIRLRVFEYTTWFWAYWPLVEVKANRLRSHARNFLTGLQHIRWTLTELTTSIDIAPTGEQKRVALAQHRTQTDKQGRDDWWVLTDVSQGEWLEVCFRPYEAFYSYEFRPV